MCDGKIHCENKYKTIKRYYIQDHVAVQIDNRQQNRVLMTVRRKKNKKHVTKQRSKKKKINHGAEL